MLPYRAALASSLLLTLLSGCKTDVQPESSSVVTVPSNPTPTPTPTATPTPAPTGPSAAPVGATGAPAIASNFDVTTTLAAASVPPVNSTDVVGAFRFICGAGQISNDDPIVYPGQPGKAHLHQFYGNTSANANSTFASLRASGDSTCNNMGNGTAANRSAYWMPAMLDGKGHVVMPDYVQVYYKRAPDYDDGCNNGQNICIGIPNGVKFIQGFNMMSGQHSVQPGWFACGSNKWPQDGAAMTKMNLSTCPAGSKVEMAISSLKCWNGQLDSPDHMSHLAGMATGGCPQSHPYLLPQFTISAFFTVAAGDDPALWKLSSDAMYSGAPRGSTLHFDYFEAWDTLVKDMWVSSCIDRKLNCSGGNLGNGKTLRGASQPKYGWTNPTRLVPTSPRAAP